MLKPQLEFPMVSILIPSLRESEYLEHLIGRLMEDPYSRKEIFVAIDAPTKKSLELSRRMHGKVNFNISLTKRGKAEALNEAVKEAKGEILLFLDSDIELSTKEFLQTVVGEMNETDILDIRKGVIRNSRLARVIHYDFLWINAINWFYSRILGKSLGLNGSAFAIRKKVFEEADGFRKVLSEDMDLAMRCYLKNFRFKYTNNIEVLTEVPGTWRIWLTQRKRWATGTAFWVKRYYRYLFNAVREHPRFLIPPMIFGSPYLFLVLLNYYLTIIEYAGLSYLWFPAQTGNVFLSTLLAAIFLKIGLGNVFMENMPLIKGGVETLASLGMFSAIYRFLARKLNFFFSLAEFIFFFFVYSPIWIGIVVITMGKVALTNPKQPTLW